MPLTARAGDWREKYKNSSGTPCCGVSDCDVLKFSDLSPTGTGGFVFIRKGRKVISNAKYISEDGQIWGCSTGCLFLPAFSQLKIGD